MRRVLVPLDGSPLAEKAVPLAATLAAEWNAQVHLVWVIPDLPPASYPYGRLFLSPADYAVERKEVQDYLDRMAAQFSVEVQTHAFWVGSWTRSSRRWPTTLSRTS